MKELWLSFTEIMIVLIGIAAFLLLVITMIALAIGPAVIALILMNGWYLFLFIPSWTLLNFVFKTMK